MNEETRVSLNKFLKEREERIKNMTLAEARDIVGSIYGHSDMRMESDKALQMLLDCADKTLEQEDTFDKIRDEIEQLPTNYIEIQRPHSVVGRDVVELGLVMQIIDKYKAESEDVE